MDVNDNVSKYPALYASSKVPLTLKAISGFAQFSDDQFKHHLGEVYDCFCDLMLVNEARIRENVYAVVSRVGQLHSFMPESQ
mmetsp:Transcript_7621/g.9447  ORF Transcript_7621/g.9447 Transcript_7621/m.9447 type:complete len:82 (-) Transcript_7621:353-598(-)